MMSRYFQLPQLWTGYLLLFIGLAGVSSFAAGEEVRRYDLYERSFQIKSQTRLNPFDSSEISMNAVLTHQDGEKTEIPCFYDGENGWKFRFTPTRTGTYRYEVLQSTQGTAAEKVLDGDFTVLPGRDHGFIRIGQKTRRFFVFDNGDSYFPLGENMGWQWDAKLETWEHYLDQIADAEVNWIRIWMCPWGMTELEWTPYGDRYHGLNRYELKNARNLDEIFKLAEERDIFIQLVINHHGQYSAENNPIWEQNPYNEENGGFLGHPSQFFTNEEAKRHYRDRLRYLVARWGYNTHLLAWEFWNEVDLTSGYDPEKVTAWHQEMAQYLREIDPYNHLLTTSVSGDHETIHSIAAMDFLQTHSYITSIIDKVMTSSHKAAQEYPDKPHFFGELSYDYRGPNKGDREGVILHNQLWASVHSPDAGTAMTWWWDNWVEPYNLYHHFKHIATYIKGIHWDRENLQPMEASIEALPENACDLIISPRMGWGQTIRNNIRIASDGTVSNPNEVPMFVHGDAHQQMGRSLTFEINNRESTEFTWSISRARTGAVLEVEINGQLVAKRSFESEKENSDLDINDTASVHIPAGENHITIKNTGRDWIQFRNYQVRDYAQRLRAYARGNEDRILMWIHDAPHQFALLDEYSRFSQTIPASVTLPGVTAGVFDIEQYNPWSGQSKPLATRTADEEGLQFEIPSFKKDLAFRLTRKQ
ncbi:MAG: DUF5060 domain-containing protein [bacterium]|jgi:hypothetical protein